MMRAPFGSYGSGRRLIGGGYFSVGHGRDVCVAELGVEQERVARVPPNRSDYVQG